MGKYNPIVMGEMLSAAFNPSELQSLAFNLDINLPDEISHLRKSGKVIDIVKYAVSRGVDEQVVNYVQKNNSYQYEQFKPRLLAPLDPPSTSFPNPSDQPSNQIINTGGGTYVGGNVTTGGDFVGGNKNETIINNNYHAETNTAEIKEIQEGIAQIMQELNLLNDIEPVVQNITINENNGIVNTGHIETISNSFNTVSNSAAPDELKEMIKSFLEQIQKLSEAPPAGKEEDVDTVVKNGELLAKEAASEKPSSAWLQVSVQELKKAAENIGNLAAPIIVAAGKIIAALGITH